MFGFDFMFTLVPILFLLSSVLFVGVFVFIIVRMASGKRKNDSSPRLIVEATVVSKRTHVWGDHSHTNYYATFQLESGDRMELEIPRDRIGYLVEGDKGRLTFQGTRFLEFRRG